MAAFTRQQLDSILQRVLEIPGEVREAFLDETCGAETDLRRVVERMLEFCEADDPVLMPGGAMSGALWNELCLRHTGGRLDSSDRVGVYRIVDTLGHGGMATVYRAERADGQFEQTVALKVLHPSQQADDLARRFEQERQILASLNHPHIARLVDGGVTDSGQPYVAMEYIEGERLDVYCEREDLTIQGRLELFLEVGDAVEYAHRNLIVHRDIKPSNILVTSDGSVRLLDFGIAKLLDASLPHSAPETRSALHPMTPEYASPEQVRGEALTTATDVYQLGYLLYCLLTARSPYRAARRNHAEVLDAICHREPMRPSDAVMLPAMTEDGADAEATGTPAAGESKRRRRVLQGDLDTVMLKALSKEPAMRYPSAQAFVDDLRRYLKGLPVTARRASFGYRARKFMRRHRRGVAGSAAFVLLLATFATAYTVRVTQERNRAQLEAAKALQVTDFLMGLFEASDPRQGSGESLTAREILERGMRQIEALDAQPQVQAQMLDVVGQVYRRLGQYEVAQKLLERAVSLRRALPGDEDPDLAASLSHLGRVVDSRGDYDAALPLYREALAMQRKLLGREHVEVARTLNNLGMALAAKGDYAAAEPIYRESLAMRRKLLGEEHPEVASSLNNLGLLLTRTGDYDQAEAMQRKALAMRVKLLGREHLDVTYSLNNLALVLHIRGDYDAAEPLYRELLALDRKLLGDEHPEVAMDLINLAGLLADKGNYDEALALHREALAMRRKLLDAEHPHIAQSLNNLATVYYRTGDYDRAEPLYREALAMRRSLLGEDHPGVATVMSNLAALQVAMGDDASAEPLFREALTIYRAALGDQHPRVARILNHLAALVARKGDPENAGSLYRKAVAIQNRATGPQNPMTALYQSGLAASLTARGRYDEAEPLLLEAYAILRTKRGEDHRLTERVRERLAAFYDARGNPEKAAEYRTPLAATDE